MATTMRAAMAYSAKKPTRVTHGRAQQMSPHQRKRPRAMTARSGVKQAALHRRGKASAGKRYAAKAGPKPVPVLGAPSGPLADGGRLSMARLGPPGFGGPDRSQIQSPGGRNREASPVPSVACDTTPVEAIGPLMTPNPTVVANRAPLSVEDFLTPISSVDTGGPGDGNFFTPGTGGGGGGGGGGVVLPTPPSSPSNPNGGEPGVPGGDTPGTPGTDNPGGPGTDTPGGPGTDNPGGPGTPGTPGNPGQPILPENPGGPTDTHPGVVPEPGTWIMMIGGFFGIGASLRIRRRRAAA